MIEKLKQIWRFIRRTALPSGDGLASRTVKSGMWLTAMNISDRLLQMGLLLVVAALLDPGAIGLLGIGLLTYSAVKQFTFLGVDDALIHNRDENVDSYLNTAWIIYIVRGVVMAIVIFAIAPFVAEFMNEPEAKGIIELIAISPILLGLRNPGIVYFRKNLEFHKQFVYSMSGSLTNFVVAVGLALAGFGVWALVLGYVIADFTRMVVSYLVHHHRPSVGFDLPKAKEMLHYGKWLTGANIIYFLLGEGDDIIVGWLLSAASLGLYQVAYQIARAPATEITQIVSRVMFPAFSKIQDDIDALRSVFYRTIQITSFIAFPVGVGIIVVSHTFVEAFLGQQWLEMVPAMQIIAVYGLIVSVTSNFGSVWKAVGRPDYMTKVGALRLVVLAAVIIPMTRQFGITGTAAAVLLVYIFPIVPIDIYLAIQAVDGSFTRFFREVSYPTVAATAMGLTVVFVDMQVDLWAPIADFVLLTVVGVVAYVVSVAVLEVGFDWGMQRELRAIVTAMRS